MLHYCEYFGSVKWCGYFCRFISSRPRPTKCLN
jgi:hypothetical protein